MTFIRTAAEPDTLPDKAWFFIFSDNKILVFPNSRERGSKNKTLEKKFEIPYLSVKKTLACGIKDLCYIGTYKTRPCYCASAPEQPMDEPFEPVNFRRMYNTIDEGLFWTAGYARQLYDWNLNFQFCGRCGTPTGKATNEHVRICPSCHLTSYPRISPAIIVAVVKENQLLLARGTNFPNSKMFSVLAGFVEPAERLEDCVKREVFEEVGIKVKNIRYFNSQPWPFPDSLMIGFTAVYDTGDLKIDPNEIAEANWFCADNLPLVPEKPSLSRELIDWFIHSQTDK